MSRDDERYLHDIVGEASKHISEETKSTLADIAWRKKAGMRDVLSHAYFGVDLDIVWDVVCNNIPALVKHLSPETD